MPARDVAPSGFEDDTYRLLDITLTFLSRYFGHSCEESERLMESFFDSFADRFDEDAIHRELSYRVAAIIHYLVYQNGSPEELGDWLLSSGNNQTPPEALEYFRETYFD